MNLAELRTDNAKNTRKRSKPDKHGHENGKSAKEPEVPSKRSIKTSLGQHWSIKDVTRKLLIGQDSKRNDTLASFKHTREEEFVLKPLVKKNKPLTHGLPRWQSVCSHFDPTDTR
ncbi:hypothetical protein Tco_1235536 [Tanacetum coccineum]